MRRQEKHHHNKIAKALIL